MLKSSEEMVKNLLERRADYARERKKRRKRIAGFSVSGGCCALVLCAAFLLPGRGQPIRSGSSAILPMPTEAPAGGGYAEAADMPQTDAIEPDAGFSEQLEPMTDEGGADGGTASPPELTPKTEASGSEGTYYLWWKEKLTVTGRLAHAIEDDPAGVFTVLAVYRPTTAEIADFVYAGKTLSEWAVASAEAQLLPDKMAELLKMGDALKYGEALYETGTPEGEIWDRRLYEDKIAYYGEELLNRYIVDGEFLREALEHDLYDMKNTALMQAEEDYARAFDAYLDEVMPEIAERLTAAGISCERAPGKSRNLTLIVTAEELENLPLENGKAWYFDLLRG